MSPTYRKLTETGQTIKANADLVQKQNRNSIPHLHVYFSSSVTHCSSIITIISYLHGQPLEHPTSHFNHLCVHSIKIYTSTPTYENSSPVSSWWCLLETLLWYFKSTWTRVATQFGNHVSRLWSDTSKEWWWSVALI